MAVVTALVFPHGEAKRRIFSSLFAAFTLLVLHHLHCSVAGGLVWWGEFSPTQHHLWIGKMLPPSFTIGRYQPLSLSPFGYCMCGSPFREEEEEEEEEKALEECQPEKKMRFPRGGGGGFLFFFFTVE